MPFVVVNGVPLNPNIPSEAEQIFAAGLHYVNGQWVPQIPGSDIDYVEHGGTVYTPDPRTIPHSSGLGIGNTILGTVPVATPGVMQNVVLAGAWAGFDPNDMAGSMAVIRAYSLDVYGSVDLGTVRYSSEALENEPTGVRPGSMERIVIPAWARRERGSPL